ncbi:hypothetical protein F3I62_15360 [Pseudomonas sp. R-28-1W-6]|nr:hypothetical protein [Pseudomonas sp. R-28-1W-6]
MLNLEISPLIGVGPIKLGSLRAEARELLLSAGFPLESSRRALDYFCNASIQVECDPDDRVRFIGISASERFIATFQSRDVFSLSAEELFSLIANADNSGPHQFIASEYLFPNQIITLWDADEQYDRQGNEARPVWAQVGIGNDSYAAAVAAIRSRV